VGEEGPQQDAGDRLTERSPEDGASASPELLSLVPLAGLCREMSWPDRERYAQLRSTESPAPRREFGRAGCRVVLVYPNSYRVGMSNLGFHTIYRIINSSPRLLCDRFFPLEWSSDEPPVSFECERPLSQFDAIAFSVAFENDYLGVLRTLRMARIPLRAEQRDDSHPIVVLGGAVTFMNPEPVADFADLIVVGQGDGAAERVFGAIAAAKGAPRDEIVAAAAGIEGVYAPALASGGPPPARCGATDGRRLPAEGIAHSAVISGATEFAETFLVEISRGCPYRCRFCAVGNAWPPFRSASADDVLALVRAALRPGSPGARAGRVGLVSSAVGDHPELEAMCEVLRGMGLSIGVSSLRADRISDAVLRALSESGTRTMTIAPEAGSERLRLIAGKHISEEVVTEAVGRALSFGMSNVRLYFIVGLPTETDEDISGLIDMAVKVRRTMDRVASGSERGQRPGLLTVSLSPFVPKPFTPLQWSAMADLRTMRRKVAMIRRALGNLRGVRVTSETMRDAYLQGLLSRGGRHLSSFLEAASDAGAEWKVAAARVGLDVERELAERSFGERLPWETMMPPGRKEALEKECRKALSWVKET